jgi:predicted ATPase/DNA-binding SARP family transcriptional activator/Tfp pilus assembly protein PilF
MTATFCLRFLGTIQVEQNGKAVRGFRSRKALALLAYLAVQSQPIPREHLAALFWESAAEAQGRANLSWVLNKLSSLLPGCLQVDRHTVRFQRSDTYWLDIDAFEELTAQKKSDSLAAAVDLYRGEFADGLYLDGCAEFEIWLVGERERWRERVARALGELIAYRSQRREYEQGLRFARRLLALEPWREETHRQVMRLLMRSGQRSAALAQYEACRRVLAEELGVEPTEETIALYERIRAADPAHRHNLPPQPTPFVGRTEEQAELLNLLDDPDCRLLTILGPGGIGKTRLALQAAMARVEVFLEGVCFVPLVHASSPDDLVYAIADALRVPLYSPQDAQAQLLNTLRGREVLLILDSFEHLLAGANLLGEILKRAPEVKLLVTSRGRLNLRWERCFEVEGLAYPESETTDGEAAEHCSAVQLFQQAANRANRQFSLSGRERPAVIRICQLVEGMPLGIELAAAWVKTRTCEEIAQEIERDLGFLAASLQDVPEQHRSLRATFERSWRLLTPTEQQVFARLSVFHGGFRREAAAEVARAAPAVLESLVDKSLLRFTPSGRYEMHELLRQYAAEKLAGMPQTQDAARDRHCVYYAAFLQHQGERLCGTSALEALAVLRAEAENVRAAWHRAVAQARIEEIEHSLSGLSRLYLHARPLQEGETLIGLAVERMQALVAEADQPPRNLRIILSRLLAEQACFLNRRGMYDRAIAAAQASVDLAAQADGLSAQSQAKAYLQWGRALLRQGQFEAARAMLEQTLTLAQAASLREVEMDCLRSLGNVSHGQSDYASAGNYYEQALSMSREISDRWGESAALANLGLVSNQQGNYVGARAYYEQALDISCAIGDRWGETLALINLGYVFNQQGDYVKARVYYRQTLRLARETGDRQNESMALACLGLLSHHLGDDGAARDYARQALRIAREIGDRYVQGYALTRLGHALAGLKRLAEAAEVYREALVLRRELSQTNLAMETLAGLAHIALTQGDLLQAQAHVAEILAYLEANTLDGTDEPFWVYLVCYRVLRAVQDPRAQVILSTACRLLQERAARIGKTLRRSFLENVAAHRELVEEMRETSEGDHSASVIARARSA